MSCIGVIKDDIEAIKSTVMILWRWAHQKLKNRMLLQIDSGAWLGDIKNESSDVRSNECWQVRCRVCRLLPW